MTKPRLWLSSPIERDLLAYLGHEGVGYALRKHCIERYECDPLLGRGYQYVGVEEDAPPKVLEHWRRLGGVEAVTKRKQIPTIVYVRGGDKHAPDIAQAAGMAYGTRHDYIPYSDKLYMLDINWHSYDWQDYLAKVAKYQPYMAMVADYERPSQRRMMYQQIRDLKATGIQRVMVCPKFAGAIAHVPKWCVIAVSVPTGYAGYVPSRDEVAGRQIHLLGGHPDQQKYLIAHYDNAQVVSVDGNVLALKAAYGQFWNVNGYWETVKRGTVPTKELAIRSGRNIREYFANSSQVYNSKRVMRCAPQLSLFADAA